MESSLLPSGIPDMQLGQPERFYIARTWAVFDLYLFSHGYSEDIAPMRYHRQGFRTCQS